jgi:hypothetical protein
MIYITLTQSLDGTCSATVADTLCDAKVSLINDITSRIESPTACPDYMAFLLRAVRFISEQNTCPLDFGDDDYGEGFSINAVADTPNMSAIVRPIQGPDSAIQFIKALHAEGWLYHFDDEAVDCLRAHNLHAPLLQAIEQNSAALADIDWSQTEYDSHFDVALQL